MSLSFIKNMFFFINAFLLLSTSSLNADTVVFSKPDSADWTLEEYQDRITDNVWITRKHNQSLFNIAQEDGYSSSNGSPVGTLWANTTTAQADSASYTNFVAMHGGSPQSLIGDTVSLYLPDDNLYFDVVFTSYTGGGGGGFSYIRTSVNSMDLDQQQLPEEYVLSNNYPNPFNPITTFNYRLPAAATVSLRVYDLNGKLVLDFNDGIKSAGRHEIILTATGLSSGTYFCVFSAGSFQTSKKVMLLK